MPLFTLSSDFGDQNYLCALVKGEILSKNKDAQIVDITHNIAPHQILQAAYIIKSSIHHFPAKSYHFFLSNLYHTREEKLLICPYKGSYLFGVDNGLFSLIFGKELPEFYAIKLQSAFFYNINNIAAAFALASNYLQKNTPITSIAEPYQLLHKPLMAQPALHSDRIDLQVLYIDNFKNVVLNITRSEFEEVAKGRNFRIEFARNESISTISAKYNDVEEGKKLCIFNAAGYLEIAVYKGNAADLFGFELGHNVENIYKTVKIIFE